MASDPIPESGVTEFESDWEEPQVIATDEPDDYAAGESTGEYHSEFIEYTSASHYVPPLRLDISDDIDDEQINGRNRRRKRKARTNTR